MSPRFRRLIPDLVSFFVPAACIHCGADPGDESPLCLRCEAGIRPAGPGDRGWDRARESVTRTGAVSVLLPSFRFDGPMRDAVHALKYSGAASLGPRLGSMLGRLLVPEFAIAPGLTPQPLPEPAPRLDPQPILVPVPLHPVRRRERGYNQAALLCEGVAEATGFRPEPGVIMRIRNTVSQTTLDGSGRELNVSGAFAAGPRAGEVAGRSVVIVDDVLTTGSTIAECAVLLKRLGATTVAAAPLAVAETDVADVPGLIGLTGLPGSTGSG